MGWKCANVIFCGSNSAGLPSVGYLSSASNTESLLRLWRFWDANIQILFYLDFCLLSGNIFDTNCVGGVGSGSLECQNSTWKLHLKGVSLFVLSSCSYHHFVFMASPAHADSLSNSVCPFSFAISTTCLI